MKSYNHYLNKLLGVELIRVLPREAVKFAKDYFKDKEIDVIEIGTFKGENAKSILKELNIKKIFLIDPYLQYEEYKNDTYYSEMNTSKIVSHKKLEKYKNIIWVQEKSSEAINLIKEKVDFIYIDGNHNYEYVKEDLNNYYKLIKENGILAGHDIQAKGVSQALLEFSKEKDLEISFGDRRDWWIIKKVRITNE